MKRHIRAPYTSLAEQQYKETFCHDCSTVMVGVKRAYIGLGDYLCLDCYINRMMTISDSLLHALEFAHTPERAQILVQQLKKLNDRINTMVAIDAKI